MIDISVLAAINETIGVAGTAAIIAAVSATVSALASVATWWRGRPSCEFQVHANRAGDSRVTNVSSITVHDVRVRFGSAESPTPDDRRVKAKRLQSGESLLITTAHGGGIPDDLAFVISWRRWRFGRVQQRVVPL